MEISPSRVLILIIVVVRVTMASIPLASELGSLQIEYGVPKVSESLERMLSGVAGASLLSSWHLLNLQNEFSAGKSLTNLGVPYK